MKKIIVLLMITLAANASAQVVHGKCSFELHGKKSPKKDWTDPGIMVRQACTDFAHLFLRQNEQNYDVIKYKFEPDNKWITLELKDVVDEVAHP